jgi:hypothetical protein
MTTTMSLTSNLPKAAKAAQLSLRGFDKEELDGKQNDPLPGEWHEC